MKLPKSAKFLVRVAFTPGLFLWGLAVRAGMRLTKITSGISLQARFFMLALQGYRYWSSLQPRNLEQVRRSQDALGRRTRTARSVRFEPVALPDCRAEWVIPPDAEPGRAILYFHGGGYTTGSLRTHRSLVSHIAKAARVRALNVGYRLAPEHPYPAAFSDARSAWRFLADSGHAPGHVVLAGDSAGGGLATALLISLRDDVERSRRAGVSAAATDPAPAAETAPAPGTPVAQAGMPAGIALLSPWLDLSDARGTWEKLAHSDWLLSPESLQDDARKYLGCTDIACADLQDPYVSPRYADLRGLPPFMVQVGGNELLREDIHAFAAKARASGTKVFLDEWPSMFHDWHLVASYLPEGRRAVEEIGTFIRVMLA